MFVLIKTMQVSKFLSKIPVDYSGKIFNNLFIKKIIRALVLVISAWMTPGAVTAASCCGGGSSSSLILPKFSGSMLSVSLSTEVYNGVYAHGGDYVKDPPNSDLNQMRLTLGGAVRLAPRLQMSLSAPYIWNNVIYSGRDYSNQAIGDTTLAMTYEFFDNVTCVWKVRELADLIPATYLTFSLLVPTGVSPYGDIDTNFQITGRGFYRGDLKLLVDKTIYPFNFSFSGAYGVHVKRPVNRDLGVYIDPYQKQLGDRFTLSASVGYTINLDVMSIDITGAYSYVEELAGNINGKNDPFSAFHKNNLSLTTSFASPDKNSVLKLSVTHNPAQQNWGSNTPVTNTFTVEVWNVFR